MARTWFLKLSISNVLKRKKNANFQIKVNIFLAHKLSRLSAILFQLNKKACSIVGNPNGFSVAIQMCYNALRRPGKQGCYAMCPDSLLTLQESRWFLIIPHSKLDAPQLASHTKAHTTIRSSALFLCLAVSLSPNLTFHQLRTDTNKNPITQFWLLL